MEVHVDASCRAILANPRFAQAFFTAIHDPTLLHDEFHEQVRQRFADLAAVEAHIHDALHNKFEIDGTPDFFIFEGTEFAGLFEFHPKQSDQFLEVGFWLIPKYRGRKVMSRVLRAMIEFSKQHFEVTELRAETAHANLAARSLLQKAGFVEILEARPDIQAAPEHSYFVFELPK